MSRSGTDDGLKPSWFHILLALAEKPRHGFGILRDVEAQTAGSVRLWPVTLYGSLEALEARGFIEELGPDGRPKGESEKKRYYRITRQGRAVLEAEAARLGGLARLARARLRKAT